MIPEINLLPNYERPNPKYLIIFTILFSIWILVVAFLAVQYILTVNEQEMLETRIGTLNIEKEILQANLQNLTNQEPVEIITIGDTFEYVKYLGVPSSNLIDEVQKLIPAGGTMDSYTYNVGQVSIQTHFNTLNTVAAFINNIEASPLVSNFVMNAISVGTSGETQVYNVGFQLTINQESVLTQFGGESNE